MTPTSTEHSLAAQIAERLFPGRTWYYNCYDVNGLALATVEMPEAHKRIAAVLAERRAKPRKKGKVKRG